MIERYLRRIYWRITGVVMIALLGALAANSYFSHQALGNALVPEMAKKAVTVGSSIRLLILKAVDLGIDFHGLHGVEEIFDEADGENPDLTYFALTDALGAVLHAHGAPPRDVEAHFRRVAASGVLATGETSEAMRVDNHIVVSLPILAGGKPHGMLHIGIDTRFVDEIVFEMLLDVLVVLFVALFFTVELLSFMAGLRLEAGLRALATTLDRGRRGVFSAPEQPPSGQEFDGVLGALALATTRVNYAYQALGRELHAARRGPTHERDPAELRAAQQASEELGRRFTFSAPPCGESAAETRLGRVRAPLFAFILAEELTRTFIPAYVKGLPVALPWLSPELVVGLPIVLFMLIVAFGQPYFGALCERLGHRRAMLTGAAVAAVGLAASGLAASVLDLLLWRSLCAVGYGVVFVAAQGYVLDHTTIATRARGFALFVGAIMVATVCGPSIGGILADNIGERLAFGVSAGLALVSILAIRMLPRDPLGKQVQREIAAPRLVDVAQLALNARFMTLTGLAAIPAKILLTGVCFYLVPLYLVSIGSTQSMAGRVLMAYAVVMVLMAPIAAALARSREHRERLVALGLVVSGLGAMMLLVSGAVAGVFAAVLLIGLGQSLSITAQSALVSEHCHAEIRRFGEQSVYGVYRLLERCGNALGPLIAAACVMSLDYRRGFVVIGAVVLVCGVVFAVATRRQGAPRPAAAEGST